MAVNPITHNTKGIFRFKDYISLIPDFLKAEDDVVVLLQVMSDYINNAYRNVKKVKKFKFKLLALENSIIPVENKLQKLADLFTLSESRDLTVLFLSMPEDLGDLEKNKYSQDPFNVPPTPNKLFPTFGGLTPRMIQFKPSQCSKVRSRRVEQVGNTAYYEVFFEATLNEIEDVKSMYEIDVNDDGDITPNYLVNYYNVPIINPDSLTQYYIKFESDQVREITDYVASLRKITISEDWGIIPDYTSFIQIEALRDKARDGGTQDTIILNDSASSTNGFYNGFKIKILDGMGNGQVREIISYNGTTKEATVDSLWHVRLIDNPQASSASSISLSQNASNIDDFYKNMTIQIVSGTGTGQVRKIVSYDGLTKVADIDTNWATNPDGTSLFKILEVPVEDSSFVIVALETSVRNASRNTVILTDGSNINDFYVSNPPFRIRIVSGRGALTENFGWSTKSSFYFDDLCTSNLNLTFWEPNTGGIVQSGNVVPTILGKYGSLIASGYANSILAYNSISSYSADLSIYVESGASSELTINSALAIGEINGTPEAQYKIGLANFSDGIYLVVYDEVTLTYIFKERVFNSIPLDTLLEGNVKILFNPGYMQIYWNDVLKFKIIKDIKSTKLAIKVITQNSFGTISHGFIDNIRIEANDENLPNEYFTSVQGKGLFYGRDITAVDKRSELLDTTTGENIYVDPIFKENDLFYSEIENDSTKPLLKLPYTNEMGPFQVGDVISRVNGVSILREHRAIVKEIIDTPHKYLILSNVVGDWVSGDVNDINGFNIGNKFGKIIGNNIEFTAEVLSNSFQWNPYNYSYNVGDLVTYKNIKYKVLKIHTPSPTKTPDISLELYQRYMFDNFGESIVTYENKINYNPYMWGMYRVLHIDPEQSPDFKSNLFSELCNNLYVQPSEELDIKFRQTQREWLFNPRVAEVNQLIRNGWLEVTKYDNSNFDLVNSSLDLQNGSVIFARKNMFDVTENNPDIADSNGWYRYIVNSVAWQKTTSYTSDTFSNTKDPDNNQEYIIDVNVDNLENEQTVTLLSRNFTVNISNGELTLSTPATISDTTKLFLTSTGALPSPVKAAIPYFAKFINSTTIKLSKTVDLTNIVSFSNTGIGTHTLIKKLDLKDGDIVTLTAQTNLSVNENGKYRVVKNGPWVRLDKRKVFKITNITVDADVIEDLALSNDPIKYKVFSDSDIDTFIVSNPDKNVYKIQDGLISNFKFVLESIEGIDTTIPFQMQYDPRFDANTIADTTDMDPSFQGVPDMGYPLVEKIERLAYQKDPSVIDLELIGYLARFLGYDITQIQDDIIESSLYQTDEERENALRRTIQTLPQYNALKSTETGLESILLTFGVVATVIKLWTDNANPYDKFIHDFDVTGYIYSQREAGNHVQLIPTPHFSIQLNVNSNVNNDLNPEEVKRIIDTVVRYKPINTVFDGVILYLTTVLRLRMSLSPMLARASMACNIGYDIDFSEQIDNGC